MAIAPIDLQTLFAQIDKVAKTQGAAREGLVMQQAIQGAQLQKKTEEDVNQVNEAQNMGEGVEKVKDRGAERREADRRKREKEKEEAEAEQKSSVLRDPSLGKKIDISL
jgi:hypothetical protein